MKYIVRYDVLAGVLAALLAVSGCATHPAALNTPAAVNEPLPSAPKAKPDPEVAALLQSIDTAAQSLNTMSADFSYAVTSARQQQLITGKVLLMKPNFMRITYGFIAHSPYPCPIASDGGKIYTFKPENFHRRPPLSAAAYDPIMGAKEASGLVAGGGTIGTDPADSAGRNIHLWDSIAIQSFFSPETALGYLYYRDVSELKNEGAKTIGGVLYQVISHHLQNGNISGGESSAFDQHVYVGPDHLIHQYVLEFTSAGNRGVQVMQLSNIQTNLPLTKADFVFTPPVATASLK